MRAFLLIAFVVGCAVCSAAQPPAQTPPPPCDPAGSEYVCGQLAPEDLVVVPGSEWVFGSVFSGSGGIRLINTKDRTTTTAYPAASAKEELDAKTYDSCPGIPDAAQKATFRPHGLALRAGKNSTHTLYAVHHGSRESVEVFEVDAQTTNIVKVNPNTLQVQEVFKRENNPAFGSGTVAVEVGKELWVGSFRGDRIARVPKPVK
jgi:hypothetical protein